MQKKCPHAKRSGIKGRTSAKSNHKLLSLIMIAALALALAAPAFAEYVNTTAITVTETVTTDCVTTTSCENGDISTITVLTTYTTTYCPETEATSAPVVTPTPGPAPGPAPGNETTAYTTLTSTVTVPCGEETVTGPNGEVSTITQYSTITTTWCPPETSAEVPSKPAETASETPSKPAETATETPSESPSVPEAPAEVTQPSGVVPSNGAIFQGAAAGAIVAGVAALLI